MIFIENRLSADCLRNALVQRGLDAEGKMTILHDWLLRYELDAPKNPVPSCFSSAEDLATRQLRFSTPVQMRIVRLLVSWKMACTVHWWGARKSRHFASACPSWWEKLNGVAPGVALMKYITSSVTSFEHLTCRSNFYVHRRISCFVSYFRWRFFSIFAIFLVQYHTIYWFCNERAEWRTWNEFVAAWRSCFSNFDFQFALYNEIIRRTQEEHESVADYLTCIQILFNRLIPPSLLLKSIRAVILRSS